jgi:transposase
MTRAYSEDLRRRVIWAIEGGASCRQAAKRYEIGESTAIRWVARWRDTGSASARPQGGDRRSHRIEAHAALILAAVAESADITLAELAGQVEAQTGARFAIGTLWRFFDRRGITVKKRRAMQPSRSATR